MLLKLGFIFISLWTLLTYTFSIHMLTLDDHPPFYRIHKMGVNLFILVKTSLYGADFFKYSLQTQKYKMRIITLEMVMHH